MPEPRTITYQVQYWTPVDLALQQRDRNPITRTGTFTVVAPMTRNQAVDAWELLNPGSQIVSFELLSPN